MSANTTDTVIGILTITSDAFEQNGIIPQQYSCNGEAINPPLTINNIPDGAQSLAIIMDDPDAPRGLYTHWLEWNIPLTSTVSSTTVIAENSNPGISGIGSSGKTGYHPPCPPNGRHRYYFKVYALDTELDLPAGSDRNTLEHTMHEHIIAQGELMGYYG